MGKIIFASGGLGNQMFEYAYLLGLKSRGIDARIDTSLYQIATQHNGWELEDVFGINVPKTKKLPFRRHLVRLLCHWPNNAFLGTETTIMEYDAYWIKPSKMFLKGVWINVSYFKDIQGEIRALFQFRNLTSQDRLTGDSMRLDPNSVSIHIRRGDYLKLADYNVCDESYYITAMRIISEHVSDPTYYVFSDDKTWCRDFMQNQGVKYHIIDSNKGKDSYKDMYLMTQCHRHIISNSTFSWWGAYLSRIENSLIIAPKYWFKSRQISPNLPHWVEI